MYNLEAKMITYARAYLDLLRTFLENADMKLVSITFIHRRESFHSFTYWAKLNELVRTPVVKPIADGQRCDCPWFMGAAFETPKDNETIEAHFDPNEDYLSEARRLAIDSTRTIEHLKQFMAPGRIPPHNGEYN